MLLSLSAHQYSFDSAAAAAAAGNLFWPCSVDGTITFTPASGFVGEVVLEYTITDGDGNFATAEVRIMVADLTPPVAIDDVASTTENVKGAK